MDEAGKIAQQSQENVEPERSLETDLQKHAKWGQKDGNQ